MAYIVFLRNRAHSTFERLDKIQYFGKPLFQRVPLWQYSIYFATLIYFALTLLFQPIDYQHSMGIIKPFLVLLNEILHPQAPMNPILNRGLDDGGHVLAYLSLLACAIGARIKMPKTSEGFYFSLLIPAFALSVSEGSFNIFYWVLYYHLWPHATWFLFILTNPLAVFYVFTILIALIITPIFKCFDSIRLYTVLSAIYGFFAFWALIGFPVTLSSVSYLAGFGLDTQWYNNLAVNSLEVLQWVIAGVGFAWATKANLDKSP